MAEVWKIGNLGEVNCGELWMAERTHWWIERSLEYRAIYLSVYLCICLSVYLFICVFVYLSLWLSVYLSVYLSICLCVGLCLFIGYLSICLSICAWRHNGVLIPIRLAFFPLHLSQILPLPRKSDVRSYEVLAKKMFWQTWSLLLQNASFFRKLTPYQ